MRKRYVDSYGKMSENESEKYDFSFWRKSVEEADNWISGGKLFQTMDAATGNERRPTYSVCSFWPVSFIG